MGDHQSLEQQFTQLQLQLERERAARLAAERRLASVRNTPYFDPESQRSEPDGDHRLLSSVQELAVRHQWVSPHQLLQNIASQVKVQANEKGLAFVLSSEGLPDQVICDPDCVQSMVLHLCHNAVRFTHSGGVSVYAQYDMDQAQLRIRVIDTGMGMDPATVNRLFTFKGGQSIGQDRFGILHAGRRLAHIKQWALALAGDLCCESELMMGTSLLLTLNCGIQTGNAELPQTVRRCLSGTRLKLTGRVLLAEDDPTSRQVVARLLSTLGLDVTAVDNGEQAVEAVLVNHFDVILMDIHMPVMDGAAAAHWLRSLGYRGRVIALTASEQLNDAALDFDGYLTKPVTLDQLYAQLQHSLLASEQAVYESDLPIDKTVKAQFLQDLSQYLPAITAAATQDDTTALYAIAHKIKGNAASFGLDALGDLAGQIQGAIAQQSLTSTPLAAQQLFDSIHQILDSEQGGV